MKQPWPAAQPNEPIEAWRQFDIRTFEIKADSRVAGRTVEMSRACSPARASTSTASAVGEEPRIPRPDFVLHANDRIAVAARHEPLIENADAFGVEIAEPSLVPGIADVVDVVVTNKGSPA